MVRRTPKRQATGSNPAGGARFSVKSPCCKGFCFLPFLVFPCSILHAFSRLPPSFCARMGRRCKQRMFSSAVLPVVVFLQRQSGERQSRLPGGDRCAVHADTPQAPAPLHAKKHPKGCFFAFSSRFTRRALRAWPRRPRPCRRRCRRCSS